uniref:Uncharacterized protein n=1 Tax=Wuchereria bancrofti TaxID=6293 RepID=A0A1I8ERU4_WUCBA
MRAQNVHAKCACMKFIENLLGKSGAQIAIMCTSKNIFPACLTCLANQPADCIRGMTESERETKGKKYNLWGPYRKIPKGGTAMENKETGIVPSAKLMAKMVNSEVVPTNVSSGDDAQFMEISTNLIWLSAFLIIQYGKCKLYIWRSSRSKVYFIDFGTTKQMTDAMPCVTGVYHAGQSILTTAFRAQIK